MPVGQASNCWFGNPKGDRFRIHFHRQATGRPDAVDSSRDSSESLSVKGRLVQYAGRLHRSHEAKTEVLIHDYLDATPLTQAMFRRRSAAYGKMGYTIEDPENEPMPDAPVPLL